MIKKFSKKIKNFNISPYKPDLTARIIIIIWGLNAIFYLGNQLTVNCDLTYSDTNVVKIKKIEHYDSSPEEYEFLNNKVEYFSLKEPRISLNDGFYIFLSSRSPPHL